MIDSDYMNLIYDLNSKGIKWEREEINKREVMISYFIDEDIPTIRNVVFDSLCGNQLDSYLER
ncbi:MAG: hypothetical protein ACXAAH_10610 [Promethearchaeota archaeon]|jgi:hypothetical protein